MFARKKRPAGIAIDSAFEQLVPEDLRSRGATEWTPTRVVVRVATLLSPIPSTCVLDVGSGIGKMCVMGALASTGRWFGIECDQRLVETARSLASKLGVGNATMFIHGDALAIEWRDFEAIYLYNPFASVTDAGERRRMMARIEDRLDSLSAFARVVTLNGFGGTMPSTFELLYQERFPGPDLDLVVWMKRSTRSIVVQS